MTNQESKALTRESIKIALIQLMKTNTFESISVTSILERAGVSRAGFYRNYPSKEAVLEEIIHNFYDQMTHYFLNKLESTTNLERYTALFQYIKDRSEFMELFLAVKQKNNDLIISNPYIEERYGSLPPEQQYCIHAVWRGIRELAIRWAQNGMKESPETMGKLVTDLYNFDMVPMD